MFNDPEWCNFVQQIGMASLGTPEETVKKLGSMYWYTSEVGVVMENGVRKYYGGAIASSY